MIVENPFGKKVPVVFEGSKRGRGSEIHPLCPAHTASDNELVSDLGLDITSTVS